MNISYNIANPAIDSVDITYKQKFPERGVSKNTITFERLEDMIVMCLSAFVHDYVHDYNLCSMYARVVKGTTTENSTPSLFENLGIHIANTIFKIIAYPIGGGPRDISMYDDTKFEDEPIKEGSEKEKFEKFYDYLKNNEEEILTIGGGQFNLETQPRVYVPEEYVPEKLIPEKLIPEESVIPGKLIPVAEEPLPVAEESVPVAEESVISVPVAEGIIDDEDSIVKTIKFNDIKDTLFIPDVISNLKLEPIIDKFENNADFLDFHSALNTYIVTYLGYDINTYTELENVTGDKNEIASKAIIASLNYIINDLKNTNNSIYFNFYGDIFSLLLNSYEFIIKKNSDNKQNPFDILNSSELLYQFIIFYVTYISVENYDKFNELINQMNGGKKTDEEEEREGEAEEEGIEGEEREEEREGESSQQSSNPESLSELLPVQEKVFIKIPEKVFITHNNLLTTIARGMFIKLGIWKRIFFPDIPIDQISPEDYKFGPTELNEISYEKLVELFPINTQGSISEVTEASESIEEVKIGNRNNELLILEILILKRLLVEMSPSKTLTFGAKIDDDLKNYMDAFYLYNYNIKEVLQTDSIIIDDIITSNPNFVENPELEKETEELFQMCDEGCDDDQYQGSSYGSDVMEGGMNYEDRMAMIKAKKFEEKEKEKEEKEKEEKEKEEKEEKEEERLRLAEPQVITKNPDIDIIEQPRPPPMPILFNKLKKMYQNNMLTIKQLQDCEIEPIIQDDVRVTNLYELLKLNQVLIHKKGTLVNIPAPKYKFVINNAANVGSNVNGSRMFIPRSFYKPIEDALAEIKEKVFDGTNVIEELLSKYTTELEQQISEKYTRLKEDYETTVKELNIKKRTKEITIREYNELLDLKYKQKTFERTEISPLENKLFLVEILQENRDFYNDFEQNWKEWFNNSQPIFGLYRSLQRGTFCPTSSMMDAMDNCSLKYGSTETKEVGTSYSEIVYNGPDGKKISFGGVVLNYNQRINRKDELTAKIFYRLDCNIGANIEQDIMEINTVPIKVSESNDLKARVAYQGVINRIKEIYDSSDSSDSDKQLVGIDYIKEMWKRMQYQHDQSGFNMLLSATALKTMGDYLQECQACFKWGGYVNNTNDFPTDLTRLPQFIKIKDKLIYRSVSEGGKIIPYDVETGNGLRLGIQGDRPSGFRSIYILLNGNGAINDQAITGYMFTSSTQNPSRSLLVARNKGKVNSNGLKGCVIYATRELQVPDRDSLLRSLEFLNVKDKNRKVEGDIVSPEIGESTIIGSEDVSGKLLENPMSKIQPLKNSAYEAQIDYNDTKFIPEQPEVEVENEKTDAEEAREQRKNKFKQLTGLDPSLKLSKQVEKEREKAEKQAQKEIEKAAKQAEEARIKAEKAQKQMEINEVKRTINNTRKDLSEKQKKAKTIPKIPLEILVKINPSELGINQEIYNIILSEAQEDKRISDLAEQKIAKEREEAAKIQAEKEEYEASPEGMEEKRIENERKQEEELRKKDTKAAKAAEEAERLAQQSIVREESQKERLLFIDNRLEQIPKELEELQKLIDELPKEKTTEQKKSLKDYNKRKETLEKEERDLKKERKKVVIGGTLSNKKQFKHKITKRQTKNVNKLTKRHKKVKILRNTRKVIR